MLGVGPNAYLNDTLRSDNDADGPFPAPRRRHAFRPPSASLLLADSLESTRRRSLMAGENRVVAGSLGFEIGSKGERVNTAIAGYLADPTPRWQSRRAADGRRLPRTCGS